MKLSFSTPYAHPDSETDTETDSSSLSISPLPSPVLELPRPQQRPSGFDLPRWPQSEINAVLNDRSVNSGERILSEGDWNIVRLLFFIVGATCLEAYSKSPLSFSLCLTFLLCVWFRYLSS